MVSTSYRSSSQRGETLFQRFQYSVKRLTHWRSNLLHGVTTCRNSAPLHVPCCPTDVTAGLSRKLPPGSLKLRANSIKSVSKNSVPLNALKISHTPISIPRSSLTSYTSLYILHISQIPVFATPAHIFCTPNLLQICLIRLHMPHLPPKKVYMFARWHIVGFQLLWLKWEMSQSLWNCKHQQIRMLTKDVYTNFKKKKSIKKKKKIQEILRRKKRGTNCPCICKKEPRLSSYQKWQLYNIRTVLV